MKKADEGEEEQSTEEVMEESRKRKTLKILKQMEWIGADGGGQPPDEPQARREFNLKRTMELGQV